MNAIQPDESPSDIASNSDDPILELHYILCSKGFFQFRHFLAIFSTIRKFRPQIVHFHAARLPPSAPHDFEWYEDLKATIPFLKLHETTDAKCNDYQMPSVMYLQHIISESLYSRHIIVQEDTVVNRRFRQRLEVNTFIASNATAAHLISVLPKTKNLFVIECLSVQFLNLLENCFDTLSPSFICERNLANENLCIHFGSNIFVRDVPSSNLSLASFIRHVYYGSPEIIQPIFHDIAVIPKIGHYVVMASEQMTEKDLSFEFYLSILSLIGIAKVDCDYIHGNMKFGGKFWDHLLKRNLCVRWHY